MSFTLTVNGQGHTVDVDGDTPLLWVLRESLGLTGTKYGCGVAACGACMVFVDGSASPSCSIPIESVDGAEVMTIEGLSDPVTVAVQAAWDKLSVVQCGYCQSGQIVSAVALLNENRLPSDQEIDVAMRDNVCRCATYVRIRAAIHEAARTLGA
jgi:isoquinoline 1-oxidoreductase alpha subunit